MRYWQQANSMSAYLCDIKKGPLSFKMLPCFFFEFPLTAIDRYSIAMIDSSLLVLFKSALQIRDSDNTITGEHKKENSFFFLEISQCVKHQIFPCVKNVISSLKTLWFLAYTRMLRSFLYLILDVIQSHLNCLYWLQTALVHSTSHGSGQ